MKPTLPGDRTVPPGQKCPKCGAENVRATDHRRAAERAWSVAGKLAEGAMVAIVGFRCHRCLHRFKVDLVKTMSAAGFDATNRIRARRGFPPLER